MYSVNHWDILWANEQNTGPTRTAKLIFNKIAKYVDFNGKSILELGCGTGSLSYLAANYGAREITLVDLSNDALEIAKRLFRNFDGYVKFVAQNLFDLNLVEKYDVVLSSGLLEHFRGENRQRCLEIHGNFSKDLVVIVVPASPHYNDIRCRKKEFLERYGWQKPISKEEMQDLFVGSNIDLLVNERFHPLYYIGAFFPPKVKRVFRIIFEPIFQPWGKFIGGLLLAIGTVKTVKE